MCSQSKIRKFEIACIVIDLFLGSSVLVFFQLQNICFCNLDTNIKVFKNI